MVRKLIKNKTRPVKPERVACYRGTHQSLGQQNIEPATGAVKML